MNKLFSKPQKPLNAIPDAGLMHSKEMSRTPTQGHVLN